MADERIVIFADGAARGNPGPGGWGAIVLTPDDMVTELGGRTAHTTNNKMELTAVIEALRSVRDKAGSVRVHTDSSYVIHGIREWIWNWRKRGWKTADGKDVLNRDYWERLWDLVVARDEGNSISWHYVPGHSGVPGNERADTIATECADGELVDLYHGPFLDYDVDLHEIPEDTSAPRRKKTSSSGKSKTAYSYLSVVDGNPMRHRTWPECERRVKGRSGARFKKATSAADEAQILRSWGFSPDDLPKG